MNYLKIFLKNLIQFIVIYILFNLISAIAQVVIVNILAGNIDFIETYMEALKNNIVIYIILYIIMSTIYRLHNKYIVKKLNTKLKDVLKGGDYNEK